MVVLADQGSWVRGGLPTLDGCDAHSASAFTAAASSFRREAVCASSAWRVSSLMAAGVMGAENEELCWGLVAAATMSSRTSMS